MAGRRELENEPAVAVWLASGLAAETFQLDFVRTGSGALIAGYQFDSAAKDLHLLLPGPYTFPAQLLLDHLNADLPGASVVGGVVSGSRGPGQSRLFRDREVLTSGLVGVRLPGVHAVPVVSHGCRPIGDVVEVGSTVQFQVRDAAGADKNLHLSVERALAESSGRPVGALLLTCTGPGRRMFGVADHDASMISDLLGGIPLAGFFAGGEIGPIAGRNALHTFTASTAVFAE